MLWSAKNGSVQIGNTRMRYARFGRGSRAFVILPGLSDGLATVRGKALLLAQPYRAFLDRFTVCMFSRKDDMPPGYSIRDMAADQAEALRRLGIGRASVMGVSQGGMIAQYLAIDHPELVERLVLAVTAPRANAVVRENVEKWIGLAREGRHRELMIDTAEKSYSEDYLRGTAGSIRSSARSAGRGATTAFWRTRAPYSGSTPAGSSAGSPAPR